MSKKSFIDSAICLYNHGFYDSALCLVCMAIDACAKEKYPNLAVGTRYKQFLTDNFRAISEIGFPGISASSIRIKVLDEVENLKKDADHYVDMVDIIYHVVRCGLAHNCQVDKSILFVPETIIGDWKSGMFMLPKALIRGLISIVD